MDFEKEAREIVVSIAKTTIASNEMGDDWIKIILPHLRGSFIEGQKSMRENAARKSSSVGHEPFVADCIRSLPLLDSTPAKAAE